MTKSVVQSELLDTILYVMVSTAVSDMSKGKTQNLEPSAQLHVLLAEDGLVNQRVAVGLLSKMGHKVHVAENGRETLDAWRTGDFDLILMDLQMPEMDGMEATEAIRAEERGTSGPIPIVAMTAAAMKGDRERCLEAGMDDYLVKPIDPKQLAEKLAKLTQRPDESPAAGTDVPPDWKPDGGDQPPSPASNHRHVDIASARERLGTDDDAVLASLVEAFLDECPQRMEEIHQALVDQDATGVMRAAHTLKGSAAVFEANAMIETALQIESSSSEQNLTPIPGLLLELKAESARVKFALQEFLEKQGG